MAKNVHKNFVKQFKQEDLFLVDTVGFLVFKKLSNIIKLNRDTIHVVLLTESVALVKN
jgi:hypothetical protein